MENKKTSSHEETKEQNQAVSCEIKEAEETSSASNIPSPAKRDQKAAKKRLKKVLTIILVAFLVLGILCGGLYLILKYAFPPAEPFGYDDRYFFPADYSKNIFDDKKYMALNRTIYYDEYYHEYTLTEDNVDSVPGSARFLYDYINCIIQGNYSDYPNYFTQEYLTANQGRVEKNLTIPLYEKFTMQGLYDIHIRTYSRADKSDESGVYVEQYVISYKIFENNGTFRRDIIPGESRELLYTVYTNKDLTKINDITFIHLGEAE